MRNLGKAVVKARFVILAVAIALLIPSYWGYTHTRINYDMLTYLPKTLDTMRGQDILEDEFGTGAISMVIVDGKSEKTVAELKKKIEKVPHVNNVIWYDSFADLSVPMEMLPDKVREAFNKGDATLMAVTFDTTTSDDGTLEGIRKIRSILDRQCYVQGVSAVLEDTKEMAEKEEPVYVGLAVLLATIVTALSMDTFLAPILFLLSIGMAIIYNLGSNLLMGQISYVTTIAGFAALCFMTFSFGLDVGIVMMKGVALGVVSCVTILPSLILLFEKAIEKTRHKPLMPSLKKLPAFVQKHYKGILIAFAVMWIPAAYGQSHTAVYYNLDKTLPKSLPSVQANDKLKDDFDMSATMMVLADENLPTKTTAEMCDSLKDVRGVKSVIGLDAFLGGGLPREVLPDDIYNKLNSKNWKLILLTSQYATGSDEVNSQINTLNSVLDKYDRKALLIGDAPCTKDLVNIANHDFNVVNWASILIIFFIIAFVFKSASLPFLLVVLIEGAIFINMAVPYYTGEALPFIASIVIGTIQLGSTVDYAILITSRYQTERFSGKTKNDAIYIAHSTSIQSILCSGFTFFAATFGVGLYSNISLISSMCTLLARGALISTFLVITVLPAILMLFDPLIVRTSRGFIPSKKTRRQIRAEKRQSQNPVSEQ